MIKNRVLNGIVGVCLCFQFGCLKRAIETKTPLAAAMVGDVKALEGFRKAGVDLNAQYPRRFNWTPLMAAIYCEQSVAAAYLVTNAVDLTRRDATGNTALDWAIELNDTNTAALIVKTAPDQLKNKEDWQKIAALIKSGEATDFWHQLFAGFPIDSASPSGTKPPR